MTASTPNVVVGVDGSDSSRQALDWAVEEATRRNLPLHILCAWRSDYTAETVAAVIGGMADDSRSIVDAAAAHARTVSPGLDVSSSTVRAQAASALIAASRHADTVVVGAHGLGALAEVLPRVDVLAARGLRLVPRRRREGTSGGQVGPRRRRRRRRRLGSVDRSHRVCVRAGVRDEALV